jgi:sporulation protein YlmC with PRC-barrel domain
MRVYIALTFAACALGCFAALANQSQAAEQVTPNASIVRLSDVSGLAVYNSSNERLGKIEDLVIDTKAGTIRYAVLSFGGLLGIGDKYFAIPWQSVSFVPKGQTSAGTMKEAYCVVDVDKDSLKSAPGFDKDHWPDVADANWQQKIDEYYRTRQAQRGQGQTR